jgi:hypothetical protein
MEALHRMLRVLDLAGNDTTAEVESDKLSLMSA